MAWYGSDQDNPGGGGGSGAPNAGEFSWIEDDNNVFWFLVVDEQSGIATYYDQPGGTAGTPAPPVKPVVGNDGGSAPYPNDFEFFWIKDSNATEWFCQYESETGDFTFFDEPDGTPGSPVGSIFRADAVSLNLPPVLSVAEQQWKLIPNEFDEIDVTDYWNSDDRFPERIEYKLNGDVEIIIYITYTANGGIDNISAGLPV